MDLLNVLDHKKNTRVAVDGTVYEIGPDGVAKGVTEAHAAKLLQNVKVWKKHDPKRAAAVREQAKKELRGSMRLLDKNGNPVNPPPDTPGPPADPMMEVYKRPPVDGPPPVPDAEPVLEKSSSPQVEDPEPSLDSLEVPETDQASPETDQAQAEAGEEEWPDPDDSMDVEYLRQMASAYDVTFNARTSKQTLVKRINAAMYE